LKERLKLTALRTIIAEAIGQSEDALASPVVLPTLEIVVLRLVCARLMIEVPHLLRELAV
jgi:hypothetical protein